MNKDLNLESISASTDRFSGVLETFVTARDSDVTLTLEMKIKNNSTSAKTAAIRGFFHVTKIVLTPSTSYKNSSGNWVSSDSTTFRSSDSSETPVDDEDENDKPNIFILPSLS